MSLYERGVELLGKLLKDEEELSQFIQENSGRLQEITGVPLKQREGEPSIYTSATGKRFLLQLTSTNYPKISAIIFPTKRFINIAKCQRTR
jgi:hypothetical protein